MKRRKSAFTLVELLAVLGIIAILIAVLIPALTAVRKMAKETQQKAQLTTIEMGLTAFKNDYGDYPPSHGEAYYYCGAQTLAEAMFGQDLLGFHPDSIFREDGKDADGHDLYPDDPNDSNLRKRRGPYLELATANAFKLGDLFTGTSSLAPNTFVICDVFGVKSVTIGKKTVKAGVPILYYRANTSSKTIDDPTNEEMRIYNRMDNYGLVYSVKELADRVKYPGHPTPLNPLANTLSSHPNFYDYITDLKVTTTTIKWPYRPDSYILISAGADGFYGTSDDICNF